MTRAHDWLNDQLDQYLSDGTPVPSEPTDGGDPFDEPFVEPPPVIVAEARPLQDVNHMTPAEYDARRFERDVEHEVRKLTVREMALRRLRAERTAEKPPLRMLPEFLAVEDEPVAYRIDGLFPVGARALLAAQFKAGKTTLMANLIRSLADGVPFLSEHEVTPTDGTIVLIDTELDERMLRRWLRAHSIRHTEKVAILSLRGRLSSFDLTDHGVRTEWAEILAAIAPDVVLLDCLRPILDAIGLDEDKEAGKFLVAFDELLGEAQVPEAVLVHHMGHAGERSRGSSRLRDWPDVEWKLVRRDPEDESSPRFFRAYGRDVDLPERELTYHADTRHLSVWGGGSRRDGLLDTVLDDIRSELSSEPGLTSGVIEKRLTAAGEHSRSNVRAALQRGISSGQIVARSGERNAIRHYLTGAGGAA